jgi:hypothetical protein
MENILRRMCQAACMKLQCRNKNSSEENLFNAYIP